MPTSEAGGPWESVWRLPGRATRALVDHDQLHRNLRTLSATADTPFMAIVKANAYGHGAVMVARTAVEAGACMLGVATVDEARLLRDHAVSAPILVLGPIDDSEAHEAVRLDLDVSVGDLRVVDLLLKAARDVGRSTPLRIHIKVDTGMHRYGATVSEVVGLARAVSVAERLNLRGVFTHFATADETDSRFTDDQAGRFSAVIASLEEMKLRPEIVHASNSAATIRRTDLRFDLTRIGIAGYGLSPSDSTTLPGGVQPALGLRSRVRRMIDLEAGDAVSYGATYRAIGSERAALVPIGYADGYSRQLSNRGWMSVNQVHASVRGRVCMDQTIVGVWRDRSVVVNNEVVIIGNGAGEPSADLLAELAGTINYEIVAGLAARVPRFHWRSGGIVAIESLTGLQVVSTSE